MRSLVRDLATRRYLPLVALMVFVALVCVVAGTWQVARYDDKHLANDDLRTNAHRSPEPVATVLPVFGQAATPDDDAVEFRSITATGTYESAGQLLLRLQQIGDVNGYTVLTPLRTAAGPTLLVARGFVADSTATLRPADVPAPPSGEVTVTGRVEASDTADDHFAALGNGQVESVNVGEAARRLGVDLYAGFVELESAQPGTAGLTVLPAPDLSNPAGGAFEWQHLAYVVQWYLFAALALAGPFVMVRVDRKRAAEQDATVAAHLALTAPARPGPGAALTAGDATGGELVRQGGDDADREADVREYEDHVRATTARLADRYGR